MATKKDREKEDKKEQGLDPKARGDGRDYKGNEGKFVNPDDLEKQHKEEGTDIQHGGPDTQPDTGDRGDRR